MNHSTNTARRNYHWKLLATASAAALLAASAQASAADSDRPTVWIDLGWQFERINSLGDIFAPPFLLTTPRPDFESKSPLKAEKTLPWAYGADAAFSFQPEGSDWVFTGSLLYGRSHGRRHTHEQVPYHFSQLGSYGTPYHFTITRKFEDAAASNNETHTVLDFQAGKDVGLGLFGKDGTSVLSVGVRYAHFKSRSTSLFREDPDLLVTFPPPKYNIAAFVYHNYFASASSEREFHGIGPSLSWKASAALAGNPQDGEISVDWGINAALLFGRQKSTTQHKTTGDYIIYGGIYATHQHYQTATHHTRSRRVTVPNVGGFAGISYRFVDAKLSAGYRADYFFGAVDGGIDTRHEINRSFMGPYASISIGLGD